jgi:hypothetical protein
MVWSIALANLVGGGLCYLFSGYFAVLATLRYTLILPSVLCLIFVGAFEGSRAWGDLYVLLAFGVLGWTMKQLRWPRPPLLLGFVLGDLIERYLFISVGRYGVDWLLRPVVLIILVLAVIGLLRPFMKDMREGGLNAVRSSFGKPRFRPGTVFTALVIAVVALMLAEAWDWRIQAKIVPMIIGAIVLIFASLSLAADTFRAPAPAAMPDGHAAGPQRPLRVHMDIVADTEGLAASVVLRRAASFLGWLVAFVASMAVIGLIPTVPLFVVAFMRLENREPWPVVLAQAAGIALFIYVVFDRLLNLFWPQTLLGSLFPALKIIPSV